VLIFVECAIVLINTVLELSSKVGSVRPESVITVSNDIDGVSKFVILGNEVGGNINTVGLRVGDDEYFIVCVYEDKYV
jgi:hypothetical protein